MNTKHTTGTWKVPSGGGIAANGEVIIASGGLNNGFGNASANAAFIVEACNSHDQLIAQRDQLLEACKAANLVLTNVLDVKDAFGNVCCSPQWLKAREQVRTAIKAGGGE